MGPTTTSTTICIAKLSDRRDVYRKQPRKEARPWSFAWLDALIAVCAMGGLTTSALYQVQMRTSTFAASDFKTLYASVWCFAHRIDAYSVANLQKVFAANGVTQPQNWYGHAPVYPWTTLALLSPISAIGMVPAAYVLTILSGALLAVAVFALMRYAANYFDMAPGWRIAIAALCGCAPLVGFGLDMGNVSVAACALCFIAFVWRNRPAHWNRRGDWHWQWIPGAVLAIAFLLKPHLAFWVGAAMLLLPERAARAVVVRAGGLVAGFSGLTAAAMAALGTLGMQTHAYLGMLAAETSAGSSMSAASREVMPVASEITSLESILGFWIANPMVRIALTCLLLAGLGLLALRQTRRVDSERGALLAVGAWCSLGMLATYHRAHDATLLLLLAPWVVDRVRRSPHAWHAWATAALYCAVSASAAFPMVARWVSAAPVYADTPSGRMIVRWVSAAPAHSPTAFILLRQAGLADLLLLLVLLLAMEREHAHQAARSLEIAEADEVEAAA